MTQNHPARGRNILIFTIGVLLLGNLFGLFFHAAGGLGGLGFISSPFVLALTLRAFAGDSWGDAGFGLHLRCNLGVYAFASLLFPAMMGGAIGLGVLTVDVTFRTGAGSALLTAIAVGLPSIFVFAFFEEVTPGAATDTTPNSFGGVRRKLTAVKQIY